jgi:opacity protein-like surface antigen
MSQSNFWTQRGPGIGYYYAETDSFDLSGDEFAWQLTAGVDFEISDSVDFFVEYRFLNYENFYLEGEELSQHLVGAGLRFHW